MRRAAAGQKWKSEAADCAAPMHYRLRGSIGFLELQKKSKSKQLFLTQRTPKTDNLELCSASHSCRMMAIVKTVLINVISTNVDTA